MADLSNKQINKLLQSAFADAAPDKAEEIIGAANEKNNALTVSIVQVDYKGKYMKRAALIAAAFIIVVGLVYALIAVNAAKIYSTVLIESDTCIEINLNRDNRPVSIGGMDNTAQYLSKRIEKGATLDEAVDNALDIMRENDSLSDISNTVLITADAPDNADELLDASLEAAIASFSDDGYSGAILTTVASDDKDIRRMSRQHRISIGKAEMIVDILHEDRSFSADLLSRLSVNDLNLLTDYRGIEYTNIDTFGVSRGCISPEDAIRYVYSEAGFSDGNAVITLDVDSYGLIYSVTVHGNNRVFIYRLDATDGTIIAVSQGEDLKTAEMADQNTPSPEPRKKRSAKNAGAETPDSPDEKNMAATDGGRYAAPNAERLPNDRYGADSYDTDNRTPDTNDDSVSGRGATPPQSTAAPKISRPTEARSPSPTRRADPAPDNRTPTRAAKPDTDPTQKATTAPQPKPTAAPRPISTTAPKPTEAPTPTEAPKPTSAPTQPKIPDPSVFISKDYLRYNGGVKSDYTPRSTARNIGIRRILNGYDIFYDKSSFPYSPVGKQGGISALVCNREQFYRLTGSADSRYDDSYFKTHALYIHMNRDANYHWIKSISAAYMDGGVLCLQNSESIGYYIPADGSTPERIYTVAYELNKSDLKDITNLIEYTD